MVKKIILKNVCEGRALRIVVGITMLVLLMAGGGGYQVHQE